MTADYLLDRLDLVRNDQRGLDHRRRTACDSIDPGLQ
jgi:hypothetical protein